MEENRTLLIVDDEPETLTGYAEFLSSEIAGEAAPRKSSRRVQGASAGPSMESYRLLLAKSGEEAIQLVENEMKQGRRVAAGFFDVKLGSGMDGLQTIRAIKAMDPDIYCGVVTAYQDRSVDEINQLFGEDWKDHWDYLNKPFTRGEIVQKARQMVAAWNRKRQMEAMHDQIIRSERLAAVGQVARGIGHEFGNILLRIIGKADLALMEKKDIAKIHEHLKVVMTAAERAGVIVRNLQSFSRTEPMLKAAEIGAPLEESLSLVSHELVKYSVTLDKSIKATPLVQIDPGALSQVFLNLIINALHAMPKGGTLKVSVESMSDPAAGAPGVAVKIADTGTGIPADVLPRIFEFAFTTKGDKGSGLGLAVSKEIVESHGGKLHVKTEIGKGTEFTIWIPLQGPAGK